MGNKTCFRQTFIAANNYKGKLKQKFSVVRYGNVMGSRGSCAHFSKQKSRLFSITDKRMTRFNITLNEAILFVLDSLKMMHGVKYLLQKFHLLK